MDHPELDGLAAVVTGGGSGIGAAVTAALRAAGARVAVLDLRPGPAVPDGPALNCDVADDDSVRAAIAAAAAAFGRLDIVVNNAGIGAQGTVEDTTDAEWRQVLEVNVLGAVRVSRAALPHLRRSPAAAIVHTCSIAATIGLPDRVAYSASKGAILALTRAMAADHLAEGIRVNCVNPGTVDTPWVQRLLAAADDPAAELEALRARQPHGRLVTAEEVAAAVLYLVSPRASSTAGTMLEVDGGMHSLRLRAPRAAESMRR
ncbi:SDR family oxidoreductase [Nocardia sp. CDC153]|uniref:SDR family NAD(P)-dependent oxidoreductase n=1 Tax=Nocardia sp. CDC153 TaxID=3112167 RepID=UPI002DBCC4AE|nr:SDR family oxidoreductase [Nocardia sp. CDC153]MEC3952982.1 SDR family oxidoreductase [Nocardia sp. CDC153]